MADFVQLFLSLQEQTKAALSRTDVLRALIWPMGILVTATIGMVGAKAPNWMLVIFAILTVVCVLLYGFSFIFCLFKDRDALRSETYSIHKLAIEQGIYGDSRTGFIERDGSNNSGKTIAASGSFPTSEADQ